MSKIENFQTQFVGAFQMVAEEVLKNNSKFDSTKICTIVNIDKALYGEYIVSDGSITFTAYSEDKDTYKINDQVRITIPNNDFNSRKYIDGKYVIQQEKPITYISPLEKIVKLSENLYPNIENNIIGIDANDNNITNILLWQASGNIDLSLGTAIYIGADFMTDFCNSVIVEGDYGLRLDIGIKDKNNVMSTYSIWLNTDSMFGDSYHFSFFSKQEIACQVKEEGSEITGLSLYLYQDNNFKEKIENQENLVVKYTNEGKARPEGFKNIQVRNIEIYAGDWVQNFQDNTLVLSCNEPIEYTSNDDEKKLERNLLLTWYNKDEINKYIGFSDGLIDLNYDEIESNKQKEADSRLMQYVGQKDSSNSRAWLMIKANLEDARSLHKQVITSIDDWFYSLLNKWKKKIGGLPISNSSITTDKYFDIFTDKNIAFDTVNENEFYSNGYIEGYKSRLEAYWLEMAEITNVCLNEISDITLGLRSELYDSIEQYYTYLIDINTKIQQFITGFTENEIEIKSLLEIAIQEHPFFLKDYELCQQEFNDFILFIQEIKNKLFISSEELPIGYLGDNITITYNIIYGNIDPQEQFQIELAKAETDNKYAIYWYKYVPGYVNETDTILPQEWKRIKWFQKDDYIYEGAPSDDGNELKNVGVPRIEDSNKINYPAQADLKDRTATVLLDKNSLSARYRVILYYNHERFESNDLIFMNSQPNQAEIAIQNDKASAIQIIHGDHSYDHYQLWGENNYLLNLGERNRRRELKVQYVNDILNPNISLPGAYIYWKIPRYSTMIDVDLNWNKHLSEDLNAEDSKTYRTFYKKIELDEENSVLSSLNFYYTIKEYYTITNTNNTIKCIIKMDNGKTTEATITSLFNSYGTSGTKYTLAVWPSIEQVGCSNDATIPGTVVYKLNVGVYDQDNQLISDLQKPPAIEQIGGLDSYEFRVSDTPLNGIYTVELIWKTTANNPEAKWMLLKIEAKVIANGTTLTTFYPIGYTNNIDCYYEGPSTIIYNEFGTNPNYFQDKIKLYHRTEGELLIQSCSLYDEDDQQILDCQINQNNELECSNMYVPANEVYHRYFIKIQAGRYEWNQSLYIAQNRYGSAMLNNWDGTLCINKNKNQIFAASMISGTKNTKNQFTGVVSGTVSNENKAEELGKISGIFGYHEGLQSFGLDTRGTAFLGKAGLGRIYFDGNCGYIQSHSFSEQEDEHKNKIMTGGMRIDLQRGAIEMIGKTGYTLPGQEETTTQENKGIIAKLLLDASPAAADSPYFEITAERTKTVDVVSGKTNTDFYPLLFFSADNAYIESFDYDKLGAVPKTGMHINLKEGLIDAYNFKLTSSNISMNSNPDEENPYYFRIQGPSPNSQELIDIFSVKSNQGQNAIVEMAGWTVDSNSINFGVLGSPHSMWLSSNGTTPTISYTSDGKNIYVNPITNESYAGPPDPLPDGDTAIGIAPPDTGEWRIAVGQKFGVTSDGTLYASNAMLDGSIYAKCGRIADWTFEKDTMQSPIRTVWYYETNNTTPKSEQTPGFQYNNQGQIDIADLTIKDRLLVTGYGDSGYGLDASTTKAKVGSLTISGHNGTLYVGESGNDDLINFIVTGSQPQARGITWINKTNAPVSIKACQDGLSNLILSASTIKFNGKVEWSGGLSLNNQLSINTTNTEPSIYISSTNATTPALQISQGFIQCNDIKSTDITCDDINCSYITCKNYIDCSYIKYGGNTIFDLWPDRVEVETNISIAGTLTIAAEQIQQYITKEFLQDLGVQFKVVTPEDEIT